MATLSEFARPTIGIRTRWVAPSSADMVSPVFSAPTAIATGPARSTCVCSTSVCGVVATSVTPRPARKSSTSGIDAEATGTENTVPLEARTTFGLPQSVTGSAAITASTPAASAVRRMAPRLPGFSRCSATTYSPGPSGCGRSASATPGVGTTARKPSGPSR